MVRLLIDCNCLCYKSLFAMGDLSHEEKRVGVVFGFIKQILTLAKKFETNRFVFCWDHRNSYRKIEYPSYKVKRHSKEQTEEQILDITDAFRQFDEIRELVLPTMGFSNIYQQSGYEADDLIAYVAMRRPDDTVIVSTDNDLLQLIYQDRLCPIKIYNFKGITDEAEFRKAWFGIPPIKWSYVAGVLKGKSLEKIESPEGKEIFRRNLPLVALPYNGIRPINLPEQKEDDIYAAKFKSVFGQYGFKSLLKEEEVAKWSKSFFGGEDGREHGANPVWKIQRN
jgi:5'-3' exonuclease